MDEQAQDQKRKVLHQRIYSAVRVVMVGSDSASGRTLCEPFNPGSSEKVERLASSVLYLVLVRLLATTPQQVVDQLIADIDTDVLAQGGFNMGAARRAMVEQATFGPLVQPGESLRHTVADVAQENTTDGASQGHSA